MIIFTTLAEGRYFFGVSALINSIIKHGCYADKIIIGYRGELPNWLPTLTKSKNGQICKLKNDFEIEFIEINGDLHMVHEKPKWFYDLSTKLEPNADEYFFFDSDIILVNRMSFFGEWVKQGVSICEDVNDGMSVNHPIRKQWIKLLKSNNLNLKTVPDKYYNSGFLGWQKSQIEFIEKWYECSKILNKISGDLKQFRVNDRTNVVLSSNQDSLNMAVMTSDSEISTIGPEAMGFTYGLSLMVHPLGPKPWDLNFTTMFLKGIPPRLGDLRFWEYANGEYLKPYKNSEIKWKLFWIKLYRFLSRFYGSKF
ncbi:hypothetical protein V6246_17670 [Algibacter sp. TI.3.09]|uniref:hypothetical protein n=1 Tax=Algibacter sp. TI.3.09 TaxID=3121298 RepID=UPI00311E1299